MRSRRIFRALRISASRVRSGPLTVAFVQVEDSDRPLVAYAVGRRIGSAVVRNRLRRRLRTVVAELAPDLEPGAYLVAAGTGAHELSTGQLEAVLTGAMRRASTPKIGRKAQVNGR